MKTKIFAPEIVVAFCLLVFFTCLSSAQDDIPIGLKRARGVEMLETIKNQLKDRYYDPSFHGVDIEKSFAAAKQDIKNAQRSGQINAIIAQFLLDLDDSHTFFLPPERVGFVDYGFKYQMIGTTCYVTHVRKDSEAEKNGLKVGDVLYSIETFEPTRESRWKLDYFYRTLSPQERLRLVVQDPDASLRPIEVKARLVTWTDYQKELEEKKRKARRPPFTCRVNDEVTVVCRLSTFATSEGEIDKMMKNVGSAKQLVLDLRRNSGGYVETLKYLLGFFFERDIKVGTEKTRKGTKEETAKTQGTKAFSGKLVVLTDGDSASAAEVFARVIQLEKRGTVMGDVTQGAVMTGSEFAQALMNRTAYPLANLIPFGASITIADLVMSDGSSLEKKGVKPDVAVLPTKSDLVGRKDVVLEKAIAFFGGTLGTGLVESLGGEEYEY